MKRYLIVVALVFSVFFMPLQSQANVLKNTPTDVGNSYRFYDEVMYLSTGGFLSSDHPTRYVVNDQMTRKHAAIMIGAALGLDGTPRWTNFKDIQSRSGESGYIQSAANAGILKGYADGTFKPNQKLSRGEMAVLLSRVDGNPIPNNLRASTYMMQQGIASGIRPGGIFGVYEGMKRGDFAAFLTRTINPSYRTKQVWMKGTAHYVNINSGVNMRKGPNTRYATIKRLPVRTNVTVYKTYGDWHYVDAQGIKGYVHKAYLTKGSSGSVAGNTTPPVTKPVTPPVTKPNNSNSSDLAYVRNQLIAIDPGHGGHDAGAVGHGYAEKTATLAISKYANNYFRNASMKTMMTRTTDKYVGLSERARMANRAGANLFISVHINSAGNDSATGLETYHFSVSNSSSKGALATYIQHRMLEAWNLRDRGVKAANFAVLRETSMPAVLVEAGFINNKHDNYFIRTPVQQQKMGKAIYLGTLDYYYHYVGKKNILPLYNQVGAKPSPRRH